MARTESELTQVRGIAFDLEGTVIDLEDLHHTAHLRAAADAGLNLSWQEALERLPHFIGGPDDKVAAEIASLSGEKFSAGELLLAKRSYFNELLRMRDSISPKEGFIEFVRWTTSLQLEVAIGTVSTRSLTLQLLTRAGLLREFGDKVLVTREDVAAAKPAPDVYYETARRIGISPKSQLVFEDSVVGLSAARSAGCRLAALPTVHEPHFVQSLYNAGAEMVFMTWCDPKVYSFVRELIRT